MDLRANRDTLITLDKVSVMRGTRRLVSELDLSISRGEIVTLIGPNGSGKSTTAKIVTGVLAPTLGRVTRRAGLRIGYVPQKLAIDWTLPLTVKRLMTLTGRFAPAQIDAALAAVGALHLRRAAVQDLSGGEFQRVLFARAMIRQPDLLVLDEPVQGVDLAGEIALYELIRTIRDSSRCGILLISHDLHVVMAQTDTVICLNGHICCRGTPETVKASPEYMRLFGHRAAPAIALYTHHHDHHHGPGGQIEPHAGDDAHDHASGHENAR